MTDKYNCVKCNAHTGYENELCLNCKLEEKKTELDALSKYFHYPVMPIKVYCDALESWFRCMQEMHNDPERKDEKYKHGSDYWTDRISQLVTDIRKSGLLYRLLYWKPRDVVRTRKCPVHKGKMDTAMWVGDPQRDFNCGCEGSGWLPELDSHYEIEYSKTIACDDCKKECISISMHRITSVAGSHTYCNDCLPKYWPLARK
jgi:hypothetical protein